MSEAKSHTLWEGDYALLMQKHPHRQRECKPCGYSSNTVFKCKDVFAISNYSIRILPNCLMQSHGAKSEAFLQPNCQLCDEQSKMHALPHSCKPHASLQLRPSAAICSHCSPAAATAAFARLGAVRCCSCMLPLRAHWDRSCLSAARLYIAALQVL